ncbi:unnamed protein product [Rotaria sp. Silwood1]|nr:unnamed protein product [Rotaria sp. Silwood1]
MSSITILPPTTTSYSSAASSNLPNINIPPLRPSYLSSNIPSPNIPPTYHHLVQQIPRKPSLYGAGQRKFNHFKRFQTGTTTTFNGYTNITGFPQTIIPPRPAPRRHPPPTSSSPYYHQHNHHPHHQYYNHHHYPHQSFNINTNNLPSLLSINPFHLPPRHHTRTYHQAQQFHPNHQQHFPRSLSRSRFHLLSQLPSRSRSRSHSNYRPTPPPIKPRRVHQQQHQQKFNRPHYHQQHHRNYHHSPTPNSNIIYNDNKRTLNGIILSDSMCSRLRMYAIKKLPNYNVELSYESGCDIYGMINWLKTPEGQNTVGNKDLIVLSLGTNDVGRYGVDVSLKRCCELISFIRQSFPGNRAIGWLALSPRWKPTRFVSAANIGQMHSQFNERLRILSQQWDFDVVDARLGLVDMRVEDGLHPSNTTGKWKYEGALREWFSSRAVARFSSSYFQRRRYQTTPTTPTTTTTLYPNNNYNNNNQIQRQTQYRRNYYQQQQQQNYIRSVTTSHNRNNSTQPFIVTTDRIIEKVERSSNRHPCFPSRSLIKFYPHKLRTKEQFSRDNPPPKEIEEEKEKLFLAANLYYQQRHYEEENKKWKIYEKVASKKEIETEKDGDDIIMIDTENIPQARPFRERYSAILNMTVTDTDSQSNENSNIEYREEASNSNNSESDNEDEKKKRKLRDTSLSPTSKDRTTTTTTTKENSIRKKKITSKKKKKTTIENDPRAPAGSPILLVTENSNKEQKNKDKDKENKTIRQDTPIDTSLKGPRPFARVFKPPVPSQRYQQQQDIVIESNTNELPKTPPGLVEPPVLSPRQSTPKTPIPLPQRFVHSPKIVTTNDDYEIQDAQVETSNSSIRIENKEDHHMEQDQHMEINKDIYVPSVVSKDIDFNHFNLFNFPIIPIESHREFLEKKMKQQEKELEELMKQFKEEKHRDIVQYQQQQDIVIESNINELPKTPPGLVEPPVLSPRQRTPKTPIPLPQRFVHSPKIVTTKDDYEIQDAQVETSNSSIRVESKEDHHMEQDQHMEINKDTYVPSVVSKDIDFSHSNLFNFPIIPIESRREFLEKKMKQQEKELEELMKQFKEEKHRDIVQ